MLLASALTLAPMAAALAAPGTLLDGFTKAKAYDPQFQAARAERETGLIGVQVARSALYPEARYSVSQLENENAGRRTVSISQPIFNVDRYVTFKEGKPREAIAEATFRTREQELAVRYFKAVSELVRAREGLVLNQAKIEAFEGQAKSAKRTYELGTGTLTDVRDSQVRLDQARAADLTLRARRAAAERQFAALTGELPSTSAFNLVREKPMIALESLDQYLTRANLENANLAATRENQKIAELNVLRAKGAWLPTVTATAARSQSSISSNNSVSFGLVFPLQAGTYYGAATASANATKALEQTREAEVRTKLEVQRLMELVDSGRSEIEIRLEGIKSAELSVEANEKSFAGGIRSKTDVLNSIQTLYQTKEEHLNAVLTLAENLVALNVQLSVPSEDSFQQVERVLFAQR
jgi:outer membrane protein TolC